MSLKDLSILEKVYIVFYVVAIVTIIYELVITKEELMSTWIIVILLFEFIRFVGSDVIAKLIELIEVIKRRD